MCGAEADPAPSDRPAGAGGVVFHVVSAIARVVGHMVFGVDCSSSAIHSNFVQPWFNRSICCGPGVQVFLIRRYTVNASGPGGHGATAGGGSDQSVWSVRWLNQGIGQNLSKLLRFLGLVT